MGRPCSPSALQPVGCQGGLWYSCLLSVLPECIWNHSVPYLNIIDRETRLQLLCQILKWYLKASENPEWWLSVSDSVIHISTHLSTKRCLKNPPTLWLYNLWMASEGVSRWALCYVTCLLSGNNTGGLQELTDELYDKNLSYKMFLLSVVWSTLMTTILHWELMTFCQTVAHLWVTRRKLMWCLFSISQFISWVLILSRFINLHSASTCLSMNASSLFLCAFCSYELCPYVYSLCLFVFIHTAFIVSVFCLVYVCVVSSGGL